MCTTCAKHSPGGKKKEGLEKKKSGEQGKKK